MRKTIVALILGIICLTGCSVKTESDSARFVCIDGSGGYNFYVVYDRTTGVEYAVSCGMYNSGVVTLLVDADGKPLIYEGEE
jgi:hypothetical protein